MKELCKNCGHTKEEHQGRWEATMAFEDDRWIERCEICPCAGFLSQSPAPKSKCPIPRCERTDPLPHRHDFAHDARLANHRYCHKGCGYYTEPYGEHVCPAPKEKVVKREMTGGEDFSPLWTPKFTPPPPDIEAYKTMNDEIEKYIDRMDEIGRRTLHDVQCGDMPYEELSEWKAIKEVFRHALTEYGDAREEKGMNWNNPDILAAKLKAARNAALEDAIRVVEKNSGILDEILTPNEGKEIIAAIQSLKQPKP